MFPKFYTYNYTFKALKKTYGFTRIFFCEFIAIQNVFLSLDHYNSDIEQIIDVMHVFIDELHFVKKKVPIFDGCFILKTTIL